MSVDRYLRAYRTQMGNAKARGVEFKLTFKEWCDFWGDDIDRRGRGRYDLQMQRLADQGAYEVGNIKKGHPKENARTAGNCKRNRKAERCALEHQAELDRLMSEESAEDDDEPSEDEAELSKLGIQSSYDLSYRFVADKHR